MKWEEEVRFKLRTVHTEMAELRRWLMEKGIPEAEAEHLYQGHFHTLENLSLKRLPLAMALDRSDLVVRYQGTLVQNGSCPATKMNRIFTNLREQILNIAKTHSQLPMKKGVRWMGDVDLLVTACTPDLVFGFKMPEEGVSNTEPDSPRLIDPVYTALKDSLDLVGVVTTSLQNENPVPMLEKFALDKGPTVDRYFIDTGLVAARKFIPKQESRIESVEIGGRFLPSDKTVTLDRGSWERANRILREHHIPKDTLEVQGNLMAVDYDVSRFSLRKLDGWVIKSLRCIYSEEQEEFVKRHQKKKIWVKGKAHFDLEGQPNLLVVDEIKEV
jgi:hypothetical protein